ncbi:MAG: hypothetical protein ACU0AZ_04470 [Paracoccaceae bacterium]
MALARGPVARRAAVRVLKQSGLFNAVWYLRTYPDVAHAKIDPVKHFFVSGASERRDPGPYFDTGHYFHRYPDVAACGLNPLLHYLVHGHQEGRIIRPGAGSAPRTTSKTVKVAKAKPRFDTRVLPKVALTPGGRALSYVGIGPCVHLPKTAHFRRLNRANLLSELALLPVGVFVIDWVGIQSRCRSEWAGLWTTDDMRLNRQIMDACRIALDRKWQVEVTGPVQRSIAPLFRTIAGVVSEVTVTCSAEFSGATS